MILAVLHLTDFHFKSNQTNPVSARVHQIIGALQSAEVLIDSCLVVVSGDIAYSGKREEYEIAHAFFSDLLTKLRANYGVCPIAIVPGNHDCDFSMDPDLRNAAIQSVIAGPEMACPKGRLLDELIRVQENFFRFWKEIKAVSNGDRDWLVYQEEFDLGGHKAIANCLNTAFLSTIRERQGSLRFPIELARKEIAPTKEADLVLAIFHHPYGWMEVSNSRALKDLIESSSDIILTGHEHVEGAYEKDVITGQHVEYIEGAIIQTEDGSHSGFNVVLCDLGKRQQKIVEFRWSGDRYAAHVERKWRPFLRNESFRRAFENDPEFAQYLDSAGTGFTHPRKLDLKLSDLFIYPELRRIEIEEEAGIPKQGSIVESEQTFASLLADKMSLLAGSEHSGKSALSRQLYRDFQQHKLVPVLIRGADFAMRPKNHLAEAIDKLFVEQYGQTQLESFKQLPSDRKVLIFDDWHRSKITKTQRKSIVEEAKRIFGHIVIITGDILRFEEVAGRKGGPSPFLGFQRYDIRQFNHRLRGHLIEKWITIGRDQSADEQTLPREISGSENAVRTLLGKKLLPSYCIAPR